MSTNKRKSLSDILSARKGSWLEGDWSKVQAAPDYGKPIPKGKYPARLIAGEPFVANTGTPGFKLRFEVREGEHQGRQVSYVIWLTDAARSGAKRDFVKLGITSKSQLERGIPSGILATVTVTVRQDDDGAEYNDVRTFDVTGVEPSDAFAPETDDEGEPLDTSFVPEEIEAAATSAPNTAVEPPPEPTPAEAPDAPGRGKQCKPQQGALPLANGPAGGPYLGGR